MNRSKTLTQLIILSIIMISIFGLIPMVQAKSILPGWPGYMFKEDRIAMTPDVWMWPFPPDTVYRPELAYSAAYFSAHMDWREDWASFWPAPPYQVKLFIDNEEIVLKRFHYYARDDTIWMFEVGSHNWIFTKSFELGFFEAGEEYEIRVEYWVQKPYWEYESNDWRLLNLFGWGEWNFTYTLIIA